jgi:membrane protein YqaA with SNARE-associated domain
MRWFPRKKPENWMKAYERKKKIIFSVERIEKKEKIEKNNKNWMRRWAAVIILLLLWPLKKLVEKVLSKI